MRTLVLVSAFAAVLPAAAQTNRPTAPLYDAAGVTTACETGLASARKTIGAMEARRGAGAIFTEWNKLQIEIENVINPI